MCQTTLGTCKAKLEVIPSSMFLFLSFDNFYILFTLLQMKNADYFSKFVTEDFTSYIRRKKDENCHGNNVEMQALSEMYNRPIEVYVYSLGKYRNKLVFSLRCSHLKFSKLSRLTATFTKVPA